MDNKAELMRLTWRLLDEEIKVFNRASRTACGIQLFYARDKTLIVRFLSRHKFKFLTRLALWITSKKLGEIVFSENHIDQLKVRIIIRKYLSKILLRAAILRLGNLIKISKLFY